MAKKIISHDDLFEPKIAKGIIKELDDLIVKGEETEKTFKSILKVLQDIEGIKTAEEFKAFTAQSEKLTKAQKELVKTEEKLAKVQERIIKDIEKQAEANKKLSKTQVEKIKLTKRLNEANSTRIEGNEILKVQIQEQNKVNKKRAKDTLNLIGAYEKESATLNKLRKKYKNLAVQNKENTKEGKDLLSNITKLDKKLKDIDDTVGQNQRSVGKYGDALKKLNSVIGKLGIIAILVKGVELLTGAFGDSREGALAMGKAFAVFSETAQVVIRKVSNSWEGFVDIIRGGLVFLNVQTQLQESSARSAVKGILKAKLALAKLDLAASFSTEAIDNANTEIGNLNDKLLKLADLEKEAAKDSLSLSDGFDLIKQGGSKIAKAFEETGETVVKAIKGQEAFLELQLRLNISIEQQERALAGLAEKRQILQDISDDDTLGFLTRAKAVEKAEKAAVDFARLEIKLAKTKETLTIEAIKQDLRRENAQTESQLAAIQTGEQLKRLLTDAALGRKISDANDEAFSDAFVERRDKEAEALSFRRDQEEKFRKTERDSFEQELDIIEEFTEKRVAANEKIISSDKSTLTERRKAFKENQSLENKLLNESIDLIIKQGKESIDLRKDLTAAEKEQQKALLNTAAIQAILNEQDATEIFNMIRRLDLGEIEEKRLKDALKINKDIAESNSESAEATEEAAIRTAELNQDILTQENYLNGKLKDLETEQFDNEKQQLEERIKLLKKDSIERLELEKELNGLLIEDNKKKAEKEAKTREEGLESDLKDAERRKEIANSITEATLDALNRKNDAENASRDAAIAKQETSLSIQEQRAKDGLSNTLAFEQQELDKARLAKQQELERQAKEQEIIALVQAYYNQFQSLSSDPERADTAAVDAFTNTLLAKSIAKGLTGFIDGTELVSKDMGGSKFSSGQDGYVAKFDGRERILNPSQNMALPKGMSNEELVQAAKDYSNGNTWGFMPTVAKSNGSNDSAKAIIESNKQVIRAIENNAASMSVDSEGIMHMMESRVSRGKKELIHFINKKYKMIPK